MTRVVVRSGCTRGTRSAGSSATKSLVALEKLRLLEIVDLLHELAFCFAGEAGDVEVERQQVEQAEQCGHVVHVALDRARNAGILDLQREVAAVARTSTVHLPDRRGGNRLELEVRKARLPTAAVLAPQDAAQLRHGHGRGARTQHGQRLRKLGWQDVCPLKGNDLTELHGRAAQLGKPRRQALRASNGQHGVARAPAVGTPQSPNAFERAGGRELCNRVPDAREAPQTGLRNGSRSRFARQGRCHSGRWSGIQVPRPGIPGDTNS